MGKFIDDQACFMTSALRCHQSLVHALISAGGSPVLADPDRLAKMTALELVALMASNNMFFVYRPPNNPN